MKTRIFALLLISIFFSLTVNAQNNQKKNDPVGNWKFEAPYAPEGYTSGTIIIGMADKKYSASMMFTGSDYKLAGEKVKIENDTISFSVFVESETVAVTLKMTEAAKMTGKAVYSEGEVPLTLTKAVPAK
jgi:hypothetical protein